MQDANLTGGTEFKRISEADTSREREISAVSREFKRGNPAGIHERISSVRGGGAVMVTTTVVMVVVQVGSMVVVVVVVVDGFAAKSVRNDGN